MPDLILKPHNSPVRAIGLLLFGSIATMADAAAPPAYDIVIRNGTVIDGSGQAGFAAYVAIKDGRIIAVGAVPGLGMREINARGRHVAPGFIDMMHQSGAALQTPGAGENKLRMDVTTVTADEMGTPVPAEKISDHFTMIEKQGIAINFGTSYSVAQARIKVMGDKAGTPTPAQLAQMQGETATAMKAGGFGVTTALIYAPISFISTGEIIALTKPAGTCGGFYSTHLRDEGEHIVEAIEEAIEIGEKAGRRSRFII